MRKPGACEICCLIPADVVAHIGPRMFCMVNLHRYENNAISKRCHPLTLACYSHFLILRAEYRTTAWIKVFTASAFVVTVLLRLL